MSLENLARNPDDLSDLVYLMDGQVYDARTLDLRPQASESDFQRLGIYNELQSIPLFVRTQNGWIIFETGSPNIRILDQDASDHDPFIEAIPIRVPNLPAHLSVQDVRTYRNIIEHVNNQLTLSDLISPDDRSLPSFDYSQSPNLTSIRSLTGLAQPVSRSLTGSAQPVTVPTVPSLTSSAQPVTAPSVQSSQNISPPTFPPRSDQPREMTVTSTPRSIYGSHLSADFDGDEFITGEFHPPRPTTQPVFQPPVPTTQPDPTSPSLFELSYQTLLKQLYGLPVEIPDQLPVFEVPQLMADVIDYPQAENKLQNGQIERYSVDEIYQPWAGPPTQESTPNRFLTLIGKDGRVYLVKARYDSQTNMIYSPN